MLTVSFSPYSGAPSDERVTVAITNHMSLELCIDDLLDFLSRISPHMCGPIHVEENTRELVKHNDCWIPADWKL